MRLKNREHSRLHAGEIDRRSGQSQSAYKRETVAVRPHPLQGQSQRHHSSSTSRFSRLFHYTHFRTSLQSLPHPRLRFIAIFSTPQVTLNMFAQENILG